MTRRLVLVRHVAVEPAARGLWIGGGSDPAPDPDALAAARSLLGAVIDEVPPARVLCSPLRRARATAALLGSDVELDDRLVERDFGSWEGRPSRECIADLDPVHLADIAGWLAAPIPGAESVASVMERVGRLWAECASSGDDPLWVVAHAGTLRALLACVRGVSIEETFATRIEPGGWLHVVESEG